MSFFGGGGGVAYDFSIHDIVYFLLIFRIAMLTSRKSSCFDCTHCAFRFTRVKQAFMQVGNQWQSINMCIMTRSDTGYVLISLFS